MRIFPVIFFFFCTSFTHSQELNNSVLFLDKYLTANANAVVRLDEMRVEIAGIREMNIHYNRVVTVLNKLGNKHTHTRVGYNNSVKVKRVEAIIYDALGNGSQLKLMADVKINQAIIPARDYAAV